MSVNYIGITIGPIVETMSFTSTPAGLWFSSYFFSTITRDLCRELQNKSYSILTLPENYIVEKNLKDDGVGTYHDRIYYVVENKTKEEIAKELKKEIIEPVAKKKAFELAQGFDDNVKEKSIEIEIYLKNFLQIHYVIFDEAEITDEGIAKTLADALDALELSQKVEPEPSNSYLRKFVRGDKAGSNTYIKKYEPFKEAVKSEGFALAPDINKIKDIISIASMGNASNESVDDIKKLAKTERYFAIVQADGDNMGKLLNGTGKNVSEQEQQIQRFSDLCMKYTKKSSELIKEYGGVLIYAGGDDLLFLAPVRGNQKETIWSLCNRIGISFQEIFQKSEMSYTEILPSISFGVSINYYKFPLFEAFQDARMLLFGEAKNFGEKNNIAVKVHKSSGQTAGFVSCMGIRDKDVKVYDEFLKLLEQFYATDKETNQLMHSILYTIENQKELFKLAIANKSMIRNLFDNVFDNTGQSFSTDFRGRLSRFAASSENAYRSKKIKSLGQKDDTSVKTLTSVLRVAKFLVEEGDA